MNRRGTVPLLVAINTPALRQHATQYAAGCNCPRRPIPLTGWPVPAAAYVVSHLPRCHPRSMVDPRFVLLIAPGTPATRGRAQ